MQSDDMQEKPASSPILTKVKLLSARFDAGGKSHGQAPSSPAQFETEKREAKQRDFHERQLARERAQRYNATLRSIQLGKKFISTAQVKPPPSQEDKDAKAEEEEEEELLSSSRRNSLESLLFGATGNGNNGSTNELLTGAALVVEERGYDEIRAAVLLNRPSTSDLLLSTSYSLRHQRKSSLTSVGPPTVLDVLPNGQQGGPDPNRLLPGVGVDTILKTFYSLYAPEKLMDADLVLHHFKNRTEALLYALECKYYVVITPDGRIIPFDPQSTPDADMEDAHAQAKRAMSFTSEYSDTWATQSYQGNEPTRAFTQRRTGEEKAKQVMEAGGESEFL